MSARASTPATPVDAATILLVRDAPGGLEVFMQVRSPRADFVAGAMVFPGGRIDPGDADPRVVPRCAGVDGLDPRAIALRVGALRELFEESGVLLARARGERALLPGARVRELAGAYQVDLCADRIDMPTVAEREDLELACDLLVPFAHWITPETVPRRFDTHFFIAPAPGDQAAGHDGGESVASEWVRPADALAAGEQGSRAVIFPTRLNLSKLGRSQSVAAALEAASRSPIVTVLPHIERGPNGPVLRIPAEAGYDIVEAPLDEIRS